MAENTTPSRKRLRDNEGALVASKKQCKTGEGEWGCDTCGGPLAGCFACTDDRHFFCAECSVMGFCERKGPTTIVFTCPVDGCFGTLFHDPDTEMQTHSLDDEKYLARRKELCTPMRWLPMCAARMLGVTNVDLSDPACDPRSECFAAIWNAVDLGKAVTVCLLEVHYASSKDVVFEICRRIAKDHLAPPGGLATLRSVLENVFVGSRLLHNRKFIRPHVAFEAKDIVARFVVTVCAGEQSRDETVTLVRTPTLKNE